jgi:hydroxymethylglutaryl-CoA synthase
MEVGIVGYGVYLPRFRIKREEISKAWGGRGRGENSVANVDEDVITMGAESALNALDYSGLSPSKIEALYFGTNSSPRIDHSLLGIIAEALDLAKDIDLVDLTSSPRASISALKSCQDAIVSGRIRFGLVVGADSVPTLPGSPIELFSGAGASGIVLGSKDVFAEIEGVYSFSSHILDRWTIPRTFSLTEYEPRFSLRYGYYDHILKASEGLLKKLGSKFNEYQHVIIQQQEESTFRALIKAMGLNQGQLEAGSFFSEAGDLGNASVFFGLARALDRSKAGDRILLLSYGAGTSDAVSFKVNERIEKVRSRGKSIEAYLKTKEYLDYYAFSKLQKSFKREEETPRLGLNPMSPALWRDGPFIRGLKGAKCTQCGYVNFPPSIRRICIRCGNTQFEEVKISRKGKVHAYCISVYQPVGLQGPSPIIIADMNDSNRFRAMGTEMKLGEVKIEMPVELVLRKLIDQNGVGVYGNLFRPPRVS